MYITIYSYVKTGNHIVDVFAILVLICLFIACVLKQIRGNKNRNAIHKKKPIVIIIVLLLTIVLIIISFAKSVLDEMKFNSKIEHEQYDNIIEGFGYTE